MPKMTYDAMVVENGVYGPFDDGRTYQFVRLADAEGSGILTATLAQGVEVPPALVKGVAECEVYANNAGKIKARLLSFTPLKG